MQVPLSLKVISPYIKKAEQLDRDTTNPDSRVVAFSCRNYALQKAISLKINDPESKKFLIQSMDQLEKDKKQKLSDLSAADRQLVCERFAFKVFTMADEEDRAGRASMETARTFNAASNFFDILEQFGDLSSEVIEKRRYSKLKAIDIARALKEGRTPSIGNPLEEPQPQVPDSTTLPPTLGVPADSAPVNPVPIESIPFAPTAYAFVTQPVPFAAAPASARGPVPQVSYSAGSAPVRRALDLTASAAVDLCTAAAACVKKNEIESARLKAVEALALCGSVYTPTTRPGARVTNAADPRAKDFVEFCAYAVAALKTGEAELAKERLTEALRRLQIG